MLKKTDYHLAPVTEGKTARGKYEVETNSAVYRFSTLSAAARCAGEQSNPGMRKTHEEMYRATVHLLDDKRELEVLWKSGQVYLVEDGKSVYNFAVAELKGLEVFRAYEILNEDNPLNPALELDDALNRVDSIAQEEGGRVVLKILYNVNRKLRGQLKVDCAFSFAAHISPEKMKQQHEILAYIAAL